MTPSQRSTLSGDQFAHEGKEFAPLQIMHCCDSFRPSRSARHTEQTCLQSFHSSVQMGKAAFPFPLFRGPTPSTHIATNTTTHRHDSREHPRSKPTKMIRILHAPYPSGTQIAWTLCSVFAGLRHLYDHWEPVHRCSTAQLILMPRQQSPDDS